MKTQTKKATLRSVLACHIRELPYTIKERGHVAWLVLRHRPFVRCPDCKGRGGAMSGYYEPEWSECSTCWDHWEALDDHGYGWFAGRLPVLAWVRATAGLWLRFDPRTPLRMIVACKLGRHRWMNEDDIEPGLRTCGVCYEHRYAPTPADAGEARK